MLVLQLLSQLLLVLVMVPPLIHNEPLHLVIELPVLLLRLLKVADDSIPSPAGRRPRLRLRSRLTPHIGSDDLALWHHRVDHVVLGSGGLHLKAEDIILLAPELPASASLLKRQELVVCPPHIRCEGLIIRCRAHIVVVEAVKVGAMARLSLQAGG